MPRSSDSSTNKMSDKDNQKRLIVVDPCCSAQSPTMRSLIWSLNGFRENGWEIELWTIKTDDALPVDSVVIAPGKSLPGFLQRWFFYGWVSFRRFLSKDSNESSTLYLSGGFYCPGADLIIVQFSQLDWDRRIAQFPEDIRLSWKEKILRPLGRLAERMLLSQSPDALYLPVSKAVARDLEDRVPNSAKIEVVPNSFDSTRFSLKANDQYREKTRSELAYSAEEIVFSFVSLGHYKRKGLIPAVKILRKLKQLLPEHSISFLVIGGTDSALSEIKDQLGELDATWKEWITLTGFTDVPEKYLSASDALLFPSFSEAFALVTIEAAALGLKLFLTRHHGSEMILTERVNGRFLDWDCHAAAEVIASEIKSSGLQKQKGEVGLALDRVAYEKKMITILDRVFSNKEVS